MLMIYPIGLALLLGWITGGRIKNMGSTTLRALILPILSFGLEGIYKMLTPAVPVLAQWFWLCVSVQYGLLFLFMLLNLKVWPVLLIGVGTMSNFAVIAANGWRMPVSPVVLDNPAMAELAAALDAGERVGYFIARGHVPLYLLGDVIHFPQIPMGFLSVGDGLLMAGAFCLVLVLMHTKPRLQPYNGCGNKPRHGVRYVPRHG